MTDPKKMEKGAPGRREQVRVRINKLRQSRQGSILGTPEIIGLAASAIMLLAALFAYFYFLLPSHSRLERLQAERTRLQRQLRTSEEGLLRNRNTQAAIIEINQSVEKFESNRLAQRNAGSMALYNQLNQLILRNGLRNTSGPTYTTLDALELNKQGQGTSAATKQSNVKWQSIFPGIGVSVTVEGPYANLRHFIRDIEASNQFIVINAVELESVSDTDAKRASLVSLRLDMATYFQRGTSTAGGGAASTTETR